MRIVFLNGEKAGSSRDLLPPGISIGRENDNDVQILSGGLSRYHAKFEYTPGGWAVRDLGSTNGTKVNGERIGGARTLKPGDMIIMGDQTIRVESAEGEGGPAAKPILEQEPVIQIRPSPSAKASDATLKDLPIPPMPQSPAIIFNPNPDAAPEASGGGAGTLKINPVEQPKTSQEEPKSQAKSIFDTIRSAVPTKLEGDIFGKSKMSSASGSGKDAGSKDASKKSLVGNLVFYVAVVGLAIICLAVFVMMQMETAKAKSKALATQNDGQRQEPFILSYEKQRVGKDNVFRFTLKIEDGAAVFTLDDLANNRHFMKSFANANPIFLKTLEEAIKKSNFMKLTQDAPGVAEDGVDEYRALTVLQGGDFNKIAVRNTYAKSSFEDVEAAVDQFAEDFGLKTVSLSVDDMRAEAEKALLKAESLFDNYQARPENLRNAIARYQLTLDYLDQFEPKPKEWDVARKRQQEAQGILDKLFKEANFSFNRNMELKNYAAAIADCQKIMDMSDPQGKRYQVAHDYKIKLEKIAKGAK